MRVMRAEGGGVGCRSVGCTNGMWAGLIPANAVHPPSTPLNPLPAHPLVFADLESLSPLGLADLIETLLADEGPRLAEVGSSAMVKARSWTEEANAMRLMELVTSVAGQGGAVGGGSYSM